MGSMEENLTGCPAAELQKMAAMQGLSVFDAKFTEYLDSEDPLRKQRQKFAYPKMATMPGVVLTKQAGDDDCIYLCGNSLGLMPKNAPIYVNRELTKWQNMGVEGWFKGDTPWIKYGDEAVDITAKLIGASPDEVAIISSLTMNLHLLFCGFYRPTQERHKILMEYKAFPSDHYLVESQVRLHGYDPESSVIYVKPRKGESCLDTRDILEIIERHGEEIAVIFLPGVQYYTGQLLDLKQIVAAGHAKNCIVGADLAHAVGNIDLHLHDWNVDFAAWCSYKYLNSGSGGVGGLFFHKRWHDDVLEKSGNKPLVRLEGWWGHKLATRFRMHNERDLIPGAAGFTISTPSAMLVAPLVASLEIYDSVNWEEFLRKQFLLTGYMELLLNDLNRTSTLSAGEDVDCPNLIEIFTPSDPKQRGCQLSLAFNLPLTDVKKKLEERGVVCDVRLPRVLRVAPHPLYNSFMDVFRFIHALKESLGDLEVPVLVTPSRKLG